MHRSLRKILAMSLALIMLLGMMPLDVVAAIIKTDTSQAIKIGDIVPMRVVTPAKPTHTYRFYNGSTLVSTQAIVDQTPLVEPATPHAATGQRFTGWYRSGAEDPITFNTPIHVAADETIDAYARFSSVYYVTFVYDNTPDDGIDNSAVVTIKEVVPPNQHISPDGIPLVVNVPGKAFSHWSNSINGGAYDFSTAIAADMTLYAVLTDKWTVSFNTHGGTTLLPQYIPNGNQATMPTPPTQLGYTFDRWSLSPDGPVYSFGTPVTENIELHAVWNPGSASYSVVHWQQNTDDNNYTYFETETRSGTVGAQTTYAAKTYTGFTLNSNKTNDPANQTFVRADGTAVKNVYYDRKVYTFKMEHRLNNSWHDLSITALRYGQSTATQYNAAVAAYPNHRWHITRDSSTSYSEAPVMPNSDLTVHGKYSGDNKYTIHYTIKGTNPPVSAKDSYVFYGDTGLHFTVEDGITIPGYTVRALNEWEPLHSGTPVRTGTIYYDRNHHTITFTPNDTNTPVVSNSIPYQADISNQALAGYVEGTTTYVKDGVTYTFGGWYRSPGLGEDTKFTFAGKTMPAENIVLYGKWTPPVHSVKYYRTPDTNGPSGTIDSIPHNTAISANDPQYTTPSGLTDADFIAWYWYVGEAFVAYDFERPVVDSTVVLHPVWKPKTYTVTYDANGGANPPNDPGTYLNGSHATLMDKGSMTPPASNRVFLGWQLPNDSRVYAPNERILVDGDKTLIAVFGPVTETTLITYKPGEGATGSDHTVDNLPNNFTHIVLGIESSPTNYTRIGYEFDGWKTPDGQVFSPGDEITLNNSEQSSQNILTAQWKRATTDVTAKKVWVGGHAVNHVAVELKLLRTHNGGGVELVEASPSISPPGGTREIFEYTWGSLPTHTEGGLLYIYSVEEPSVPNSYTAVVTGSGYAFTVTNTYHNLKNVEAKKYWYGVSGTSDKPAIWFTLYRTTTQGTDERVPGMNPVSVPPGNDSVHWQNLLDSVYTRYARTPAQMAIHRT